MIWCGCLFRLGSDYELLFEHEAPLHELDVPLLLLLYLYVFLSLYRLFPLLFCKYRKLRRQLNWLGEFWNIWSLTLLSDISFLRCQIFLASRCTLQHIFDELSYLSHFVHIRAGPNLLKLEAGDLYSSGPIDCHEHLLILLIQSSVALCFWTVTKLWYQQVDCVNGVIRLQFNWRCHLYHFDLSFPVFTFCIFSLRWSWGLNYTFLAFCFSFIFCFFLLLIFFWLLILIRFNLVFACVRFPWLLGRFYLSITSEPAECRQYWELNPFFGTNHIFKQAYT